LPPVDRIEFLVAGAGDQQLEARLHLTVLESAMSFSSRIVRSEILSILRSVNPYMLLCNAVSPTGWGRSPVDGDRLKAARPGGIAPDASPPATGCGGDLMTAELCR
jgi:hypothetical protein